MVFDLKDSEGNLLYASATELAQQAQSAGSGALTLDALKAAFDQIDAQGMAPVPRLYAFQDHVAPRQLSAAKITLPDQPTWTWYDGDPKNGGQAVAEPLFTGGPSVYNRHDKRVESPWRLHRPAGWRPVPQTDQRSQLRQHGIRLAVQGGGAGHLHRQRQHSHGRGPGDIVRSRSGRVGHRHHGVWGKPRHLWRGWRGPGSHARHPGIVPDRRGRAGGSSRVPPL